MIRYRAMILLIALTTLATVVTSQITFSRDWSGGKRALPSQREVGLDCAQFTRLCRHFVHELKTNMVEPSKRHSEDSAPVYDSDDEK